MRSRLVTCSTRSRCASTTSIKRRVFECSYRITQATAKAVNGKAERRQNSTSQFNKSQIDGVVHVPRCTPVCVRLVRKSWILPLAARKARRSLAWRLCCELRREGHDTDMSKNYEIGRASCRERVEISVVTREMKTK